MEARKGGISSKKDNRGGGGGGGDVITYKISLIQHYFPYVDEQWVLRGSNVLPAVQFPLPVRECSARTSAPHFENLQPVW